LDLTDGQTPHAKGHFKNSSKCFKKCQFFTKEEIKNHVRLPKFEKLPISQNNIPHG
jgi:hypothetical protein